MSRIILALATACVALTTAYHHAAIAQVFSQSDNRGIHLGIDSFGGRASSWNNEQKDGATKFFSLPASEHNLEIAQARPNSNNRAIDGLDRQENPPRVIIRKPRSPRRPNVSRPRQNSGIRLDSHNFRQPHNLVVTANAGTQISGRITLDGKVIQTIRGRRTAINLSRCLSKGRHTIEISGNYRPASSSVEVEFSGPGTTVSQETGGSGTVRQTLILDVR